MNKSHIVSALKFRPQTFGQVVGQRHIVQTLTNALEKGRVAHAYLFSGTRGVGKTTTARILAKSLNCHKGPTGEPCLECDNCKEIAGGSALDVVEIDGASNTGIDNIRDLKESVMFTPSKSRYKIYIIDEVHQISKAAFNALLKTLEEPPAHVIFIFATTELSKVPETIQSRCQCFEYKPISLVDITAQLEMIAKHENVETTPGAIETVARRARGSMRDAQSMFDQSAAYGGGKVNEDDVKLILGLADRSTIEQVIDAVISGDMGVLVEVCGKVTSSGVDPGMFMDDLASVVRDITIAGLRPESLKSHDQDDVSRLIKWAEKLDHYELQRFFDVITETMESIRYSTQPNLHMEMGVLRLASKGGRASIDGLIEQVTKAQVALEKDRGEKPIPAPLSAPDPTPPRSFLFRRLAPIWKSRSTPISPRRLRRLRSR